MIGQNDFDPNVMPYDSAANDIVYVKIINCDTFKKHDIYNAAILSVTKIFNSANDVVQLKDETTGKIIVKALFNVTYKGLGMTYPGGNITYMASISIKDGKCKIEISQMTHHRLLGDNMQVDGGLIIEFWQKKSRPWKFYVEQAHYYCLALQETFTNEIISNLKTLTEDDW